MAIHQAPMGQIIPIEHTRRRIVQQQLAVAWFSDDFEVNCITLRILITRVNIAQ